LWSIFRDLLVSKRSCDSSSWSKFLDSNQKKSTVGNLNFASVSIFTIRLLEISPQSVRLSITQQNEQKTSGFRRIGPVLDEKSPNFHRLFSSGIGGVGMKQKKKAWVNGHLDESSLFQKNNTRPDRRRSVDDLADSLPRENYATILQDDRYISSKVLSQTQKIGDDKAKVKKPTEAKSKFTASGLSIQLKEVVFC